MKVSTFVSHTLHGLRIGAASLAVLQMAAGPVLAAAAPSVFGGLWDSSVDRSGRTATPIKHVIVIIGENRSFDHVFATYVPTPGHTVHNLLSAGIIQLDANKDALPGPNFRQAHQLATGTNNWYAQDGYGEDYNAGYPSYEWDKTQPNGLPIIYGGGSYSNCSDPSQHGVKPILDYLKSLHVDPRCQPNHYYLLNNYNPGWFGNGNNAFTDQSPSNTPFTVPPSSTPSIGDDLNNANVSWKYYGDQWNNYVNDPYQLNWSTKGPNADEYCNICNPFQYDSSIMSNPAQVAAHIQDTVNLYSDIANGTLPAVSFVKPSGYVDGHPSSSKLDLFEGFVKKIVDQVEASPIYTQDTVILITEDEGGGYYDSGYVQPVDFFGDGTRIPLIVVANPQYLPLRAGGYISHQYADHVSILKFIERNWRLPPVTQRSRDNFPNPVQLRGSYAPVNSPALDDLFDFFDFSSGHGFF